MLATFLAVLFLAPPQTGPDVVLEDYVVQPGDSCAKIARQRFGNAKRYDIVHAYNELGPLPHDLQPGLVLHLPANVPVAPDAELTQTKREVRARPPAQSAWTLAQRGLDLFRGWRVNTLHNAFAEVTFRDATQIYLRENTLVIIYGDTSAAARRKTTTAVLDKGALRSSLAALSGKPATLQIDTPSANTNLRGGLSLVTVDDAGASRVANHGDGSAAVTSKTKARRRVKVAKGMGSKVEKGKDPTPPKPLPATPLWAPDSPTTFVVPAGGGGTIRGGWSPVDKAVAYRVELGQDVTGGFVSTAVRVPGTVHAFEAHNLEPGKYFAIVSAVDDDTFESIPSRMLHAQLLETALQGGGGAAIDVPGPRDGGDAPSAIPVVLGSAVVAPAGMQCAFGDGALSAQPYATQRGPQSVRCVDAQGGAVPGFAVDVYGLAIAPVGALADGIALPRGTATAVSLHLEAPGALPSLLRVEAPQGVRVTDQALSADGVLSLSITASQDAPQTGVLRIVTGAEQDPVELGAVDLRVEPRATATVAEGPATPPSFRPASTTGTRWIERWAPTRNLVELGAYGGVFFPHPRLELFRSDVQRPDYGFKPYAPVAGLFGLRAGYAPLRFLAVELDGMIAPTRADRQRATLWALRGHVVGQLGLWRLTPYVLAGLDALGVRSPRDVVGSDVDGALHLGVGLKFFASRRTMLRLEARDTISAQRGVANGVAHSPEVTLGLGVTLMRPKR